MPASFPIPAIDPVRLKLMRALTGSGVRLPLLIEGETLSVRFLLAPPPVPPGEVDFLLPLTLGGCPGEMSITLGAGGNWFKRWQSAPPLDSVPEPYRSSLVLALNEELLEAIQDATGLALEPAKSSTIPEGLLTVGWEARNAAGTREASGHWTVDARCVEPLVSAAGEWARPAADFWLDRLPLMVPILLGPVEIGGGPFGALLPGDVILLPPGKNPVGNAIFGGSSTFPVTCPHKMLEPSFQRGSNLVLNFPNEPQSMTDKTTQSWTDAVPIELAFQVGTLTLSIAELKGIEDGHIFELTTPLKEPVTILANGRPAGKGELVQIGDRIGVILTEKLPLP